MFAGPDKDLLFFNCLNLSVLGPLSFIEKTLCMNKTEFSKSLSKNNLHERCGELFRNTSN